MAASNIAEGVYAALPTLYDDTGKIDQKGLDHLVDYLVTRDLAGLAILTEAAEDALLRAEERRALVTAIGAKVAGKKPLLVSISAPGTREAAELAKHAAASGATAIILAPFRLPGIGYRELYRHLDVIAKAIAIPVLLDARAENAVDALAAEELATLAKHASLAGVFLPDAPAASVEAWAKRMKKRTGAVLTGASLAFSASSKAGATGSICGMAVIAADIAPRLFDGLKRQDMSFVNATERRLAPAVELLGPPHAVEDMDPVKRLASRMAQRPLEGSQLIPVVPFAMIKEALRLQGHPVRARVRSPYEPVSQEVSERLKAALKISGLIS